MNSTDLGILKNRFKGSNFKELLKAKKISIYRLSKLSGIAQRTMYYWLKGTVEPSEECLIKVATILGMANGKTAEKARLLKEAQELKKRIDLLTKG